MEQKHVIMGTAGHVDHGKTALIRALTGFDCDTHQEEKRRGITINLGFTHLAIDDQNSIGIVDVPGHADFINTMISGAAGIDFVLLVIAADEGIMPQTYEHLEIMKLLQIKNGFVVLTKVDLVDDDLIELAMEEISEFKAGTFLENAPILPFSIVNNYGLEAIVSQIKSISDSVIPKSSEGIFRMYIDRIFSVQGFGTIVNGSVLSGKTSLQDDLFLLPENREIRIRNMQRHGKNVETIFAGDRGSLNIVGLKKNEFQRGMLLVNQPIKTTQLIDVRLSLFKNAKSLTVWNQVIFLLQTYKLMVKVHLLDKNSLRAGETAVAQLYLPVEIVALIGDCFIIRDSSDTFTLGGGEVIDPFPLHHRRRKEKQIEQVKQISTGEVNSILENATRKSLKPLLMRELLDELHLPPFQFEFFQKVQFSDDIKKYQYNKEILLIQQKVDKELKRKIVAFIHAYHQEFPIYKTGRTKQELLGLLNAKTKALQIYLDIAVSDLQKEGILKELENTWTLTSHTPAFHTQNNPLVDEVENLYKKGNGQLIQWNDLKNAFPKTTEKELKMIITFLEKQQKLVKIEYNYFHADFFHSVKGTLIAYLQEHSEKGITVAEFRDIIKGNRKVAMLLLDYFEKIKVVENRNLVRFLRNK